MATPPASARTLDRVALAVGIAVILSFEAVALIFGPPDWPIPRRPVAQPASVVTPAPLPDGGRDFTVASSATLLNLFDRASFDLAAVRAGDAPVPRLYLASLPADLAGLDQVGARKRLFLRVVLPLVLRVNAEIAIVRTRAAALLDRLAEGDGLRLRDARWLIALAGRYGAIDAAEGSIGALRDPAVRRSLLRRIDGVPVPLALAQAIIESGWGRSRFAYEGNALYGQWTWDKSQGIAPAEAPDAGHAVRSFDSLAHSVRAYMHNLNTHARYVAFREARAAGASSRALAGTLTAYSERGAVYGEELARIIDQNDLDAFAGAELGATNIRRGEGWRRLRAAPGG